MRDYEDQVTIQIITRQHKDNPSLSLPLYTIQASGSPLGGSPRVLEYDHVSDYIPRLATANTPIIIASP